MKNLSVVGYDKYAACVDGNILSLRSGKYLKVSTVSTGYSAVTLSQDGKRENFLVHRLIATAYLPNPENKRTVNHKDGVPSNNELSNLEWATDREQAIHYIETGLKTKFKNEYREQPDETIHALCKMIVQNFRTKEICDALNVSQSLVCNVRKKFQYTDISNEYNFDEILPVQKRIGYDKIKKVCEMLEEGGHKYSFITSHTGVGASTISRIKNKLDYTLVSNNYNF